VITAAAVLSLAPPTGAEPTSTCPDGFAPFPAAFVEQGERKDKNDNGVVCGKVEDGRIVGGPDDDAVIDDILV
jgi:hypothetical protein